jgi:hypothetical protein
MSFRSEPNPSLKNSDATSSGGVEVSRRVAALVGLCFWLVGIPLAHGLMPWAISQLAARHGWEGSRPARWNLVGLMPVTLGAGGLAWVFVTGFSRLGELPARVRLGLAPVMLLTRGPFAFSRNPMYLKRAGALARLDPFLRQPRPGGSVAGALGLAVLGDCATGRTFPGTCFWRIVSAIPAGHTPVARNTPPAWNHPAWQTPSDGN